MEDAPLPVAVRGLAERVHDGQVDKSGRPYMAHVDRVAARFMPSQASELRVAYLHDVVEDGKMPMWKLLSELPGLPTEELDAVLLLTRPENMTYADYIVRLSENPLARVVKISDLMDNLQPWRHTTATASLIPRYQSALKFLVETYRAYGSTPPVAIGEIEVLFALKVDDIKDPPAQPLSPHELIERMRAKAAASLPGEPRVAEDFGFHDIAVNTNHMNRTSTFIFRGPDYSTHVEIGWEAMYLFSPADLVEAIKNLIGKHLTKNTKGGTP
jgi:hypothetical protein